VLALVVLKLDHLGARNRARNHPWPVNRVMTVAIVRAGGALLFGLPDAGDGGRLLGTRSARCFLSDHDVFKRATSVRARTVLVVSRPPLPRRGG
jgi:hypothetical protein